MVMFAEGSSSWLGIITTTCWDTCGLVSEGWEIVEKENWARRPRRLRLIATGCAHAAVTEDSGEDPEVHRRADISIRRYGVVSTAGTAGAQRTLP